MSKAKITKKDGYRCAPEGHTVVTFPFGAIVTGQIAEWALADKAASRMFPASDREKKVTGPTETKRKAPAKRATGAKK